MTGIIVYVNHLDQNMGEDTLHVGGEGTVGIKQIQEEIDDGGYEESEDSDDGGYEKSEDSDDVNNIDF